MKVNSVLVKNKNFFQIVCEKKGISEVMNDAGEVIGIEIEGYASTKDKDRVNDIVEPKAFKEALDMYMTNPVVLLQHNSSKPIGTVTEAEIKQKGLYIKARITEDIDGVMSALKNGVIRAFSIGYRVRDYEEREVKDENDNITGYEFVIKNLELYEISLVSIPANPYALMKSLESCIEIKETKTETKDVEEEITENDDETPIETTDENAESNEDGDEVINTKSEEESDAESDEETEEGEVVVEGLEDDEEKEEILEEEKDVVVEKVKGEPETAESDEEVSETVGEVTEETNGTEVEETVEETEIESEVSDEAQESENVDEVATDKVETNQVDEGKDLEKMATKNIHSFIETEIKSIKEEMEKQFEAYKSEKDGEVEKLNEKLKTAVDVIKDLTGLVETLDNSVSNTVVKSGYAYEKLPTKQRKTAYNGVVKKLKNF